MRTPRGPGNTEVWGNTAARPSPVWVPTLDRPREGGVAGGGFPSTPSCLAAFEAAPYVPKWREGDEVEVAWEGKGYQGSWAAATVVRLDGQKVLVRFHEFCDDDGSPLVEAVKLHRLRLPPPPVDPEEWRPSLGDEVEALWNDCWWEGSIREMDVFKGALFQYRNHSSNWVWLPLRCTRPLTPHHLFYPPPREAEEGEEAAGGAPAEAAGGIRLDGVAGGISLDDVGAGAIADGAPEWIEGSDGIRRCGVLGCQLPDKHAGLCMISVVKGSRRQTVEQRSELRRQQQMYREIQKDKHVQESMKLARADALLKAEERGAAIKATRGNRAQWHANFTIDEFSTGTTDLRVLQPKAGGAAGAAGAAGVGSGWADVRGVIVLGPRHTIADLRAMLLTELQLRPAAGTMWELRAVRPATGAVLADLTPAAPHKPVVELLPPGECALLVGNCLPPRAAG